MALAEPWFVSQPGSYQEDQGFIVVRGLDIDQNKALVYILDAKTMHLIYSTLAPASVPFGFHNRFYTRADLGMNASYFVNEGKRKPMPSVEINE